MISERVAPKTDPEDFVEDLELFAELIKVMGKDA
jgi:hypothetical protein